MICIFIACTNVDECKSVCGFFLKANLDKRCLWTWNVHNTRKMSSNISLGQQSSKEKKTIECKEVLFTWLVGKQYLVKCQPPT